jgi:putative NADH-flavin reductase
MKTIALFGGTGRTGIPFIKKAVNNYKIKALVRNPEKLKVSHKNLEVVKGDILNDKDVETCIEGADVVVTLIGHDKNSPADLQTLSTKLIIDSMGKHNVKRLVSLTGAGVRDTENDQPKLMDKMVVFVMKNLAGKTVHNALLDGIEHARVIRQSGLDWTIVRGPMLTEEPAKGHVEVGYVGKIPGIKLTRDDLAQFILNEIEENKYINKMPFVTNGK